MFYREINDNQRRVFIDAVQLYDAFAEIFKTAGIKSITAVYMEVPCCSGLPMIVKKGLEAYGQSIPMNDVIISTRGKLMEQINVM